MIYCGECGAQNDERSERCASCGTLLALPVEHAPEGDPGTPRRRRWDRRRLFPLLGVLALCAAVGALFLAGPPLRGNAPGGDAPLAGLVTPTAGPSAGLVPRGTPSAGAPAGPEGWIVFSGHLARRGKEYDRDLYAARADGGGALRRLTDVAGFDGQPSWSPTGDRIAFASERTKLRQIWVMGADGSKPRRLTNDPNEASYPDWSPDGRWIAYEGGAYEKADIAVIPARGGRPRRLTDNPYRETAPAWSPDGRQIAFMGKHGRYWQIFVMERDGSQLRQVTEAAADHRYPRWERDGRGLLFNTRTGDTSEEVGQIYRINLDGTGQRPITRPGQGRNGRPFPSPDGRYIAFNSDRVRGNFEIYISRADGSDPRRLTSTTTDDYEPAWSPLPQRGAG